MSELGRFANFCASTLTTESGAPMVLEPFQRTFLTEHFDGTSETVVLLPKKNGKSTVLAAVAIYHLLTTPFAEVAIVAASRDQAANLLRQAQGFIRRSEALRKRLAVKQREISHEALGGRIRVLASDVDTFDGWLGTLGLVDELHRHRSPELYGLIREGIGPRNGRMVTISTAGDDEDSPLGRLRTAALALPGLERNGAHRRVRTDHLAYHEWSLDPDADTDDLDLVLTANPASWIDRRELERRRTASMRDWQWKRFTCGIWSVGEDSAISEAEWRACAEPGLEIEPGADGVVIGVDLGWRWDSTAIVPIRHLDGRIEVHPPTILVPPQDGSSLDAEEVFTACEAFAERWPRCTFVADPEAGGEQLMQRLDKELAGVTLLTHSQRTGPMCAASQMLAETIAEKRLAHPDDEALNRHILAAAAKFIGERWRFVKPAKKKSPIDACIALAMAVRVLQATEATPKTADREVRAVTGGMVFS